MIETLAPWPLPTGIRSRRVAGINRLKVHLLEAGHEGPDAGRERPCVLLLHGFPELSYSWRRVMPALAAAGYHVVAPDQRGYGRTLGEAGASRAAEGASYDDDLTPFRLLNLVRDALGLVAAIGRRSVAAVIGHDFGSIVAAWCALVRPGGGGRPGVFARGGAVAGAVGGRAGAAVRYRTKRRRAGTGAADAVDR